MALHEALMYREETAFSIKSGKCLAESILDWGLGLEELCLLIVRILLSTGGYGPKATVCSIVRFLRCLCSCCAYQESFFWPCPTSSLEVVYKMLYFSISPAALRCSLCKTFQACPFCHLYLWSSGCSFLGPCHWPGLNWHLGERVSMVVIYRWNEKNQEGHLKKEAKKNQ